MTTGIANVQLLERNDVAFHPVDREESSEANVILYNSVMAESPWSSAEGLLAQMSNEGAREVSAITIPTKAATSSVP